MFNISIAQISIMNMIKYALQFQRKSNQHCPNHYQYNYQYNPHEVLTPLLGINPTISITPMRVQGIVVYVTVIGTQKFTISARQLSSFIGKAMSTSPVTRKLPTITTRHCQITIAIVEHWETPIILGKYCKEGIYFFGRTISI